jgi:hypothetical protein
MVTFDLFFPQNISTFAQFFPKENLLYTLHWIFFDPQGAKIIRKKKKKKNKTRHWQGGGEASNWTTLTITLQNMEDRLLEHPLRKKHLPFSESQDPEAKAECTSRGHSQT